jgi:hypothetical protein
MSSQIAIRAKDLCAYVLVIAQKKSGNVTKPL